MDLIITAFQQFVIRWWFPCINLTVHTYEYLHYTHSFTHMIAWSLIKIVQKRVSDELRCTVFSGSPPESELSCWKRSRTCAHLTRVVTSCVAHDSPLLAPAVIVESQASFWAKILFSFSKFLSLALLNDSAAQLLITNSKEEECISQCTWVSVCVCVCVCVSHIYLTAHMLYVCM